MAEIPTDVIDLTKLQYRTPLGSWEPVLTVIVIPSDY